MLGILIGTDEGLVELIPGDAPRRALEGGAVTSVDYRSEVALAAGPSIGAWLHDGSRWRRIAEELTAPSDGQPEVRAVRVGPDGALYLGLEPAGLLVSSDGGASWAAVEGIRTLLRHERSVKTPPGATAPYVAGIVFPSDGLVVGVAGAGAWGSRDGGTTWLRRSDGLDPMVRRMWEHPERGERLYASTDSGFYRTDDAGFSWVQSLRGLDRSFSGDAVVIPGAPDHVLLAVSRQASGAEGALFRSINGGLSWERTALGRTDEFAQRPLITRVWDTEDTLFALAEGAVWGSHDGGKTWVTLAEGLPRAAHVLVGAL